MIVISIDPGKNKTGIAVVCNVQGDISHRVVKTENAPNYIIACKNDYPESPIICGDSTTSKDFVQRLRDFGVENEIIFVDETKSSEEARMLYWDRHRKPWYLFFLPSTMIVPKRSIDDYAAMIIARRYLKEINAITTNPMIKSRRKKRVRKELEKKK